MKTSNFFIILLAILISSCGDDTNNSNGEFGNGEQFSYQNNQNNQNQNNQNQNNANNPNAYNTAQNQNGFNKQQNQQGLMNNGGKRPMQEFNGNNQQAPAGKKTIELKDDQGQVIGYYPVPKDWNHAGGNDFLKSSNGVLISKDVMNEFSYSDNPQYNQMLKENKVQVKAVKSMERFIKEDIANMIKSEGLRITNIQRTPAVTQMNAKRGKMWFKAMPEQMSHDSAIVDFVDQQGKPSFMLISYYVGSSQYQKRWGYSLTGVEAPKAIFAQTKNDFMYAVLNSKINPQYVQQINQRNQQASQQSAQAHQGRMQQIRNFGEANTRAFKTRSEAFDIQRQTWANGQRSSDRMHTNTVNGINEVSVYQDGSGNTYNVDGYHNKVYKNGNGEYIGTDNYNYNPNLDNGVDGNWEEIEIKDNGWNN